MKLKNMKNKLIQLFILCIILFFTNCNYINNVLDILATKMVTKDCQDNPRLCNNNAALLNQPSIINIKITATNTALDNSVITFNVSATATNGGSLGYQWLSTSGNKNDFREIANATNSMYQTGRLVYANDNGRQYKCKIYLKNNPTVINYSNPYTVELVGITTEPSDVNILDNNNANFIVITGYTGVDTVRYQWQMAPAGSSIFIDIPTATTNNYTTPSLTYANDNGRKYRCKIYLSQSSSIFSYTSVRTVYILSIITQPQNTSFTSGGTASFEITVGYTGVDTVRYQWQISRNGDHGVFTDIPGAINRTYTTNTLTHGDNNNWYICRVSLLRTSSVVISSNLRWIVLTGIVTQPINTVSTINSTATFSVDARNENRSITYQWQTADADSTVFNDIVGATNSSYTTPNLSETDHNRKYRCQVSLDRGNGLSNNVVITAVVKVEILKITAQPSNIVFLSNQENANMYTYSVTAVGTNNIGYQWQSAVAGSTDFIDIRGSGITSTNSTYTPHLPISAHNTQYRCKVFSKQFPNRSLFTNIVVATHLGIFLQPQHTVFTVGSPVTFSIGARGSDNITYQWYSISENNTTTLIEGATNSTYTTPNLVATDVNQGYFCIVSITNDDTSSHYTSLIARLKRGNINSLNTTNYSTNDVIADSLGNVYFIDDYVRIHKIDTAGNITTVFSFIGAPSALAIDNLDNIYIADWSSTFIYKIDTEGTITHIETGVDFPFGLDVDINRNIYVAYGSKLEIVRVLANGTITRLSYSNSAEHYNDVAVDSVGNIYVVASGTNSEIIKITPSGIQTVVYSFNRDLTGDDNPIAMDPLRNDLYIFDNGRIDRLNLETLTLTHIAGSSTASGLEGDGGIATSAGLGNRWGFYAGALNVDALGNVYIADFTKERIRRIN